MRGMPNRLLAGTLAGLLLIVSGCAELEERTIVLQPVKAAGVHHITWSNFGICHSRLERRAVGSWLRNLFNTRMDPLMYGITGYEVGIARGESCHLREVHQFQTAVQFDFSSLPAGAIARATLNFRARADYGTDPPILTGTTDQCRISSVLRATAAWDPPSVPPYQWDGMLQGLVEGEPLRPASAVFGWGAPFHPQDVTRTVVAWVRGEMPNNGFIVTPDRNQIAQVAGTVDDLNEQMMCGVTLGDARLEISMLVRRSP